MNKVCIIKEKIEKYPSKETLFRPSIDYPEYIFKCDISREENLVYEMVRQGLIMMEFDKENIGTSDWNPLKEIIKPGDYVLIKPNLVLHENRSKCGTDCLFTNPSLVAAVIDYVILALKGRGKIIVGDAPLQECEFEVLIKESGYDQLIAYYRKKEIDISLVDFRNIKTFEKKGLHYLQSDEEKNGVIVKLDEKSAFSDIDKSRLQNLRITNYDPTILQEHHSESRHEYNISQYVLDADVIINIPKPKTHRKAGVTISLKNLVGINTNKEFLPHHTLGSKEENGDAYLHKNILLKLANDVLDIKNQLVHSQEMDLAREAENLYELIYKKGEEQTEEKYWEGSWYGNDTIWRTIIDLNRILLYADKKGRISDKTQRKLFIFGDMIVSGEKEGPLAPTPIYPGLIIMGDDPLKFDRAVCSLMGFDYHDIPTLYNDRLFDKDFPISDHRDPVILSNDEKWSGKSVDEIREKYSLNFQPTLGWIRKLGNRYRDHLYNTLLKSNTSVYVFGAGENGKYAMNELNDHQIGVEAFCDNNTELWGNMIYNEVYCISPDEMKKDIPVVISVQDRYVKEVTEQIMKLNGKVIGIINRGI